MADVEQTKNIIPFVTSEITFGQNVCELMFGISVSNLNFRIKIPSMRKPASREITSASVELCKTEVCFMHVQLIGIKVRLPENAQNST